MESLKLPMERDFNLKWQIWMPLSPHSWPHSKLNLRLRIKNLKVSQNVLWAEGLAEILTQQKYHNSSMVVLTMIKICTKPLCKTLGVLWTKTSCLSQWHKTWWSGLSSRRNLSPNLRRRRKCSEMQASSIAWGSPLEAACTLHIQRDLPWLHRLSSPINKRNYS